MTADDVVWVKKVTHEAVINGVRYRIVESTDKHDDRVSVYLGDQCVGWAFSVEHAQEAIADGSVG